MIHGYIYISAMDECFLSFKFNCGGTKEKLSKAGSDRKKSMIDSSKVYDDGKHVRTTTDSKRQSESCCLGFTGTVCQHIVKKKKSLAKVNLARGMFHFMILIYTISLGVNKKTKSIKVGAVKVYDTNLMYSRIIRLQASDRPVDISDLLAHEHARVPSPLFTDSGELGQHQPNLC